MFQALLTHPQEVLHKRHLVYCVRIMSVGCGKVTVTTVPGPVDIIRTQYTKLLLLISMPTVIFITKFNYYFRVWLNIVLHLSVLTGTNFWFLSNIL
jgi:hypothetical protein